MNALNNLIELLRILKKEVEIEICLPILLGFNFIIVLIIKSNRVENFFTRAFTTHNELLFCIKEEKEAFQWLKKVSFISHKKSNLFSKSLSPYFIHQRNYLTAISLSSLPSYLHIHMLIGIK